MTPEDLAETHALAFSATRSWDAAEFSALLNDPATFATGSANSFVLMRVILDEAEVLTLATRPQYRRQGLARGALSEAESKAQASGSTSVFLEVAEDNAAARALYASCGYQQVGRRQRYYTPKNAAPIAALILRKDLAPS